MISTIGNNPHAASVTLRIRQLRRDVRRRDARPNDGRCGNVAAALEAEFGWKKESGYLKLLDGTVSWVHCWNRLEDRTIVDATADQFQDLWLGDVVVLDPSTALASNYLPAPDQWDLELFRDASGAPSAVRCEIGDEVLDLSSDDQAQPWMSLARQILCLVTGWALNDELVELAARALRATAEANRPASTADLIRPLLTRSIQHLGAHGMVPWVAAEFLEPV